MKEREGKVETKKVNRQLSTENNFKKGFTLVELAMVVVILGIIAGFSIPNYQKSVARAYLRDARNNLIIIREANQVNRAQQGAFWPTSNNQDLVAINSNLRVNILANGVVYICNGTTGITFSCTAQRGADFTLTITEVPIFIPPSCTVPANCNPKCTGNVC